MMVLAILLLIVVHGPEGQEVQINIAGISSIRQPRKTEEHFGKNVKCLVYMSNGRFVGTVESCFDITQKIAEIDK